MFLVLLDGRLCGRIKVGAIQIGAERHVQRDHGSHGRKDVALGGGEVEQVEHKVLADKEREDGREYDQQAIGEHCAERGRVGFCGLLFINAQIL